MRRIASASALALLSSVSLATTGAVTGASAATAPVIHYAALGDAYAGGEGAPANLGEFDQGSSCQRASVAWPRVFARSKRLSLTATNGRNQTTAIAGHIACTGADTASIVTATHLGEPAQVAQLKALRPKPDLITITVGATDAHLRQVMLACLVNTDCADTLGSARTIARGSLIASLKTAYGQVRAAAPTARIVTVGYPRLYSPAATAPCGLGDGTLEELDGLAHDLDDSMASAARASGVEYVSQLATLAGHELCTAAPWVNALESDGGVLTARSGHPTIAGHAAMASVMASYLTKYPTAASAKPNTKPTAAFTYKRKAGSISRVVLDGTSSKDADGFVRNWAWTSKGTVLGTGRTVTISLGRASTMVVTLTVIDDRGAKASVTRTVSARSALPR
jgi:lysophospholipase L1-like esterase